MVAGQAGDWPNAAAEVGIDRGMTRALLSPIEALAAMLEHGDRPAPMLDLISRFGDVVQLFDHMAWARRGPDASFVRCRLCNESHSADVIFEGKAKRARYYCVVDGRWAGAEPAELETRVVQLGIVLSALRGALAPIAFPPREEIPGVLWRLGESTCCGRAWTAMFARGIRGDTLAAILERLPHLSTKAGLVLTTTPISASLRASGFYFRCLPAVMYLDADGTLRANEAALEAGLGLGRPPRPTRGRPPDYETEALAVIDAAAATELQLDDDALMALVAGRIPGLKTKNHGVIAKTLRETVIARADVRCAELGLKR
jgi:hypothetical protein